jgi:predicted nucleic acid-binding protein
MPMPDKIFVDTNVLLYLLSNVSLKKFQLSLDDTREILKKISEKTIIYALEIKNIYKYQFYDCLIIATALENHCTILYCYKLIRQCRIFYAIIYR